MDVSKNIRAARTEKGITQVDIARQLGIERTNYHRLENRGNKLTIEQATAIAQALDMSLIDLLTWGEQTNETPKPVNDSEQQKRMSELEDRLKDKQFIIEKLTKDIKDTSRLINVYMDYLKFSVSEYLRVGILHYTDATGNTVSIPYKNITNEEYHRLCEEFRDVGVETSYEDNELVIKTMFTDEEFATVAGYFMNTGFIEDKELIDAYEKYHSDSIGFIPYFQVKKLVDINSPILRALEKGGLVHSGGKFQ